MVNHNPPVSCILIYINPNKSFYHTSLLCLHEEIDFVINNFHSSFLPTLIFLFSPIVCILSLLFALPCWSLTTTEGKTAKSKKRLDNWILCLQKYTEFHFIHVTNCRICLKKTLVSSNALVFKRPDLGGQFYKNVQQKHVRNIYINIFNILA